MSYYYLSEGEDSSVGVDLDQMVYPEGRTFSDLEMAGKLPSQSSYGDYEILKQHFTLFNTHTGSKKLHTLDMLIANHPFFRFHRTARDNVLDTVQYYRSLSFEEKSKCKYTITELLRLEKD